MNMLCKTLLVLLFNAWLSTAYIKRMVAFQSSHTKYEKKMKTSTLDEFLVTNNRQSSLPKEVVVIGSGPVGLATAVMLAQQGVPSIKVFDQLNEPPKYDDSTFWGTFKSDRNYNLGLGGRGQTSLKKLGLFETVQSATARLHAAVLWDPKTPPEKPKVTNLHNRYQTLCIERDRLAGCILHDIERKYSDQIKVQFNTRCNSVSWRNIGEEKERCVVELEQRLEGESVIQTIESELVLGADGANSVLRESMARDDPEVQYKVYEDNNPYLYRTLPIYVPRENFSSCPADEHFTLSARTSDSMNLEALPTKEGVHLGAVLFKPGNEKIARIKTIDDAREFFAENFPMCKDWITDDGLRKFVSSTDCKFPRFQYVYPKLHRGRSSCLLGDSIHSVKPYFGLGVNSGFEDVIVLRDAIASAPNDLRKGLETYSNLRAKEARALVTMSHR